MTRSHKASPPTPQQVEKIRLLMSTYQDGTGQYAVKGGGTLPNWRDFERAVSAAMNGVGTENKSLFDVVVRPAKGNAYGISCKMREELTKVYRQNILHVEITNSARLLSDALKAVNIVTADDLIARPSDAGHTLLTLIESWGETASKIENISLAESYYLILFWKPATQDFQLFQLPLTLPDASELKWYTRNSGVLVGEQNGRKLIEWYSKSGGQLKYFPFAEAALWKSELFRLEPLPFSEFGYGITRKAETFFPQQWVKANEA